MVIECPECHHPQWDYPVDDAVCGSIVGHGGRAGVLRCSCSHETHRDPTPFDEHRRRQDRAEMLALLPLVAVLVFVALLVAART